MAKVYIGVGSNLGERRKNCFRALELLEKEKIFIKKKSSFYETEPWGIKDQPMFLNMVLEIETDLKPQELLQIIKKIEKKAGREKTYPWGPRAIDLDILLFDNIIINDDNLKIPHPLMCERDFVLRPLCEIAPYKLHPVLQLTIEELLHRLNKK